MAYMLETNLEKINVKRYQRGEFMLAVMAVMLVVAWLGRGHMGMMGTDHGSGHAHAPVDVVQAAKGQSPAASAPTGPVEHTQ